MARKRKNISKKLRFEVLKRDEFTCTYCGDRPPNCVLHLDHVVPVAEGGANSEANLVTACEACNLGKGVSPMEEIELAFDVRSLLDRSVFRLGDEPVGHVSAERLMRYRDWLRPIIELIVLESLSDATTYCADDGAYPAGPEDLARQLARHASVVMDFGGDPDHGPIPPEEIAGHLFDGRRFWGSWGIDYIMGTR